MGVTGATVSSVFGTKTVEAKADAKETKSTAKKTTTTAKKTTTKKAATTTKTAAKSSQTTAAKKAVKKELFVQYLNQQVDVDTLEKRVSDDLKNQNIQADDLKLYLKPEDNACYYVANGNIAGRVDLF